MVGVVQLLFKDLSASMFVPVLPDGSSVCSSCCTQDIDCSSRSLAVYRGCGSRISGWPNLPVESTMVHSRASAARLRLPSSSLEQGKGRIEHLPATRRIGKRETARRDLTIFSVDRRRLASYHNHHAPTTVRADHSMLGLEGEYVPTGVWKRRHLLRGHSLTFLKACVVAERNNGRETGSR